VADLTLDGRGLACIVPPGEAAIQSEENAMLWTIIVILLVLWLLGLIGSIGGPLINLLLVVAAVVLVYQLLTGRRAV
jgi:hypothetical protein